MALEQLSIHEIVNRAVERGEAALEWRWVVERYDDFLNERCKEPERWSTVLLHSFSADLGVASGFAQTGVRA